MLHEDGDDDVDQHELSHQHEYDEEDGGYDVGHAAVANADAMIANRHKRINKQMNIIHVYKDGSVEFEMNVPFRRSVAVFAQGILHDSVPIVARRHAEQGQESDAKVGEMRMFAKSLARMFIVAF